MIWRRLGMVFTAVFLAAAPAAPIMASPVTADTLFAQAKGEASQEHKNILLVFSASWCGPCKLYESFLEDQQMRAINEKAFVVVRIDVGEFASDRRHADTPGGEKLRSELGAAAEPGYPFLVITDEQGNPIVNSYRNGDVNTNVGYPAAPEEIDWYIEMLKRAAPGLSAADLGATRAWLEAHAPREASFGESKTKPSLGGVGSLRG